MKKVTLIVIASLVLGVVPALAGSAAEAQALEQYVETIKGDIVQKRDSAMRVLLELDQAEAKVFWPMLKAYDKELKRIRKKRVAMLKEFIGVRDRLTAEKATELAHRAFAIDDERKDLRRTYFERMSTEISPIVAVQFLQLQGQFETMGDMKLATAVPLATK